MPVRILLECDDSDVRACVMGLLVASLEAHKLSLAVKPFEKQMEIVVAARAAPSEAADHIRTNGGQITIAEMLPLDPAFVTHSKGQTAGGKHAIQVASGMANAANGNNPFLDAGLTPDHYNQMTEILTAAHQEVLRQHDENLDDEVADRVCQVASARLQHFLEQTLPTLSVKVHATYYREGEGDYRFMIAAIPDRGDSNGDDQN